MPRIMGITIPAGLEISYLFTISKSWSEFSVPQKQSWLDAGNVPGMNGYNLFVQDQAYRIKNLLGGFADPSTFHQYLVGHINLSGSATALIIRQSNSFTGTRIGIFSAKGPYRYFDISSPGTDGRNGYTITVKLDANRIIQIISEIAADIVFRINGYWKQTRIPKITINRDTVYLYDGDPNAAISLDVYALFMRS